MLTALSAFSVADMALHAVFQDRIAPFGDPEVDPGHSSVTGNRGRLVDHTGKLVRSFQGQDWVTCGLEFKGRPSARPRKYTKLFFLDEATASAVGHRPCGKCRFSDAKEFHRVWKTVRSGDTSLEDVDAQLHDERTCVPRTDACAELPFGTMVRLDDHAWLVVDDGLRAWTEAGYAEHRAFPQEPVTVLTPPSTVAAIRAGWRPGVHESLRVNDD